MAESRSQQNGNLPPDKAKDAVFVPSDPVPEGVIPVRGIDFNLHKDEDISVVDLVDRMSNMGFQASALGDAVRIINEMVRGHFLSRQYLTRACLTVLAEDMEGQRYWRPMHHLPGLHVEFDIFWSS